ncbi:hypothetical protein HR12_35240 [Microbacterium sp. SUBG005]|nr:hypothetical protein HR12_35240 [Microbacterium sp. SUBG005]
MGLSNSSTFADRSRSSSCSGGAVVFGDPDQLVPADGVVDSGEVLLQFDRVGQIGHGALLLLLGGGDQRMGLPPVTATRAPET